MKVVQQGSPCPVLQEGQRTQPGLQGRSSGSNPCDTSSCILRALPAPWSPCSRPQSTNPVQQGRVALRRSGRTPQTLLQAGTCGQCYLQLGKLVRLAAGVLSIDELGQQELPELGALQGEVENTHPCKTLCISGTTALPTQNPSSQHQQSLQMWKHWWETPDGFEVLATPTQVPQHQSCCCLLAQVMPCSGAWSLTPP